MPASSNIPPESPNPEKAVSKTAISEALSPDPIPRNRWVVFLTIALLGAAADLLTKQWMFSWRGLPGTQDPWWLIENYVGIETAVNPGAVFGMGAGRGLLFASLSVVAGIGIMVWLFALRAAHQWWLTIALACVMAGIFGNLYDRLGLWWFPEYPQEWKSGVRDWILFQASPAWKWPNFNIADSLLVTGAGMLLWQSFFPNNSTDRPTHTKRAPILGPNKTS